MRQHITKRFSSECGTQCVSVLVFDFSHYCKLQYISKNYEISSASSSLICCTFCTWQETKRFLNFTTFFLFLCLGWYEFGQKSKLSRGYHKYINNFIDQIFNCDIKKSPTHELMRNERGNTIIIPTEWLGLSSLLAFTFKTRDSSFVLVIQIKIP